MNLGRAQDEWYVFDLNATPWAIGPVSVGRRNGKVYPIIGRNQELANYQDAIKELLVAKGVTKPVVLQEGEGIDLEFYFWRQTTKNDHQADATNMQKGTEDALQGVLFANDRDVCDVRSTIMQQGPNVHGKVVVRMSIVNFMDRDIPFFPVDVQHELNWIDDEDKPSISDNVWPPHGAAPF